MQCNVCTDTEPPVLSFRHGLLKWWVQRLVMNPLPHSKHENSKLLDGHYKSWLCSKLTVCQVTPLSYLFIFSADDDQEGVMDNLLEALKTGSAFNVNREKRDGKRRTPRAAGGKNSCFPLFKSICSFTFWPGNTEHSWNQKQWVFEGGGDHFKFARNSF